MHIDTKESVSLSELIGWVKKEILEDTNNDNDAIPLFVIDEVTVEVNFVLTGGGKGGFDFKVVKVDSEIAEERVQKAIVKMKPIVPYERIRAKLEEQDLSHFEDRVVGAILKGIKSTSQDVQSRE